MASRIGGIPEAVEHNRSGLMVPPQDSLALSAAIARLVSDGSERRAMGAEGRRLVARRFRRDRMIAQIESLYDALLNRYDAVPA